MPLPRIRLYADATGPKSVLINGEEVIHRISEVGMKFPPHAPAELWVMHRGELDIEGEGIVRVVSEQPTDVDEAAVICDFLDSIDPAELEQTALENLGLGESNATDAMIEVLKRWARDG